MTSAGSRIVKTMLAGLLACVVASPRESLASGFGFPHGFHHGYVTTSSVRMSNVGTSSVLMPMVHPMAGVGMTSGALLPASVMPMGVTTNLFSTASVPAYYSHYTLGASGTQAAGVAGSPATAPPLLAASVQAASVNPASLDPASTAGDFRAEYNAFVYGEQSLSPSGLNLDPRDAAAFQRRFATLAGAVGGGQRLGSIGRFLSQRLRDPNFQAKAMDLFAWIISTADPSLAPLVNRFRPDIQDFLGQLQGNAGATGDTVAPPPVTNRPSLFGDNSNEPIRVLVTFENSPPATGPKTETETPAPIKATTEETDPTKLVGARLISTNGTIMTFLTADGRTVTFDLSKPPKPPTDQ